MFLLEK